MNWKIRPSDYDLGRKVSLGESALGHMLLALDDLLEIAKIRSAELKKQGTIREPESDPLYILVKEAVDSFNLVHEVERQMYEHGPDAAGRVLERALAIQREKDRRMELESQLAYS